MIIAKSTYLRVLEERDYLRQQLEQAQAREAVLHGHYAEQVARLHDLSDRMHQMVRDGYRAAAPEPPYTGPEPLPTVVLEAIGARALDRDVAQDMEAWARTQLAQGAEPGEVVQRIWRGEEGL